MFFSEFIAKVYSYLEGSITIEDFEDWLVPRLPIFFSLPHSSMTDLVYTIELGLAEMGSGVLSEKEFRSLVRDHLQTQVITIVDYPGATQLTSTEASYNLIQSVLSSTEIPIEMAVL